MYGSCGTLDGCRKKDASCLENLLRSYMFYLAFENSNCDGYITEKFWRTLKLNIVPVVMGGIGESVYQTILKRLRG